MQAICNAKIKSLQTMRHTINEISSPTTATSSGQDIQAHVGQSDGDITATIRPPGEPNVAPTKAVHLPARPIRRPCTPPPGPARHRRAPTPTRPLHQGRACPPALAHSGSAVGRRGRRTEWVGATRRCRARPAGPRYAGLERSAASPVHWGGRDHEYISGIPAGVVRLGNQRRPSPAGIRRLLDLVRCPSPFRRGSSGSPIRGVGLLAARRRVVAALWSTAMAADLEKTQRYRTNVGEI